MKLFGAKSKKHELEAEEEIKKIEEEIFAGKTGEKKRKKTKCELWQSRGCNLHYNGACTSFNPDEVAITNDTGKCGHVEAFEECELGQEFNCPEINEDGKCTTYEPDAVRYNNQTKNCIYLNIRQRVMQIKRTRPEKTPKEIQKQERLRMRRM